MNAEKALLPDTVAQQVQVDLGAMSHRGHVRPTNEDHYLVTAFDRSMRALLTSLPDGDIPHHYADTGYALLVADGMGGAAGGGVASRTAISALIEMALHTPDWIMRLDEWLANEVLHRMSERIERASAALVEKARNDPRLTGMGTTITIACSVGLDLLVAHVGDSRAYLLRNRQLYRLTSDHTMAQALAKIGAIAPEEVESHPMRHMLTRAVGSDGGKALPDLSRLRLEDGDQVLLCTDGLTDMVGEAAIGRTLQVEMPAAQTCSELVEMALEGGGKDNITVVLARYHLPKQGDQHELRA